MKKEIVNYEQYLNKDVKIFPKNRKDPVTGRVTVVKKKFLVILAKKAIKQENKIIYTKKSIKIDDIDRVNIN
jgi:DNA phosphorothioation-dependent restriction protein DptG